jgi:hypothetical protein
MCSTNTNFDIDKTCFSHSSLKKIAKAYTNYTNDPINLNQPKSSLLKDIKTKISHCGEYSINGDLCIKNLPYIQKLKDKEIEYFTFKPHRYDNGEMLTSLDIENVINQLEKSNRNFKFLNAVPIDVYNPKIARQYLKHTNIHKLISKYSYISIVFNLDPHYMDGSHWVCIFIDVKNKEIEYFDSMGRKMPSSIKLFLDNLKLNFEIKNKNKKIQGYNSNCGVYCIYFIEQRLKGKSYENIINNVNDEIIENMKNKYFL